MFRRYNCSKGIHKFQPRYSKVEAGWVGRATSLKSAGGSLDDLYEKRYECDVCVLCGKVVKP
jgi:hypothetical protein